ncbi:OTU-like cysteine protease, putative [Plasmodium relictum]|uniref:OTU-like cysteine protease, putative n=1 Tax=Plasmodium relictum TaxID=85471 RepID=A0A1J1H3N9_PLARL|nr:OTU-like cysteine protease, putative [Plasmodium relictum]CRG99176.1 OTU-like cysteine protease, putative [Plasmodium relictum]
MKKQKRNNHQKRKKNKEKKNKNYEDNERSEGEIIYSLINDYYDNNFKKNFYIKSIRTDGNCLFRAVSDQLYNHEDNYKEIRKKVVDHLSKKEEEYKNFVEYDESYKSYIERISLDGTWGGQLELQAIGEIYNVNILIYQENGCILEIKNHSDEKKCIQLHYASSEHYNSVRFKNKALDNELKTISYLREILNNKDENDSTKTFYETTENELTDSYESHNSTNVRCEKKKNYLIEEKSSFICPLNNDEISDCLINSKSSNNIGFLSDDENTLNSIDILQGIYNGVKNKNTRSRSMPNINENFLYFFSKNRSSENMESDSTIDNLNEKKVVEKKKKKNKKNKIIFMKFTSFNEDTNNLNKYFYNNTINENKTIHIYYNKLFYKCLCLSKGIKNNDRKYLSFNNNNIYKENGIIKKGDIFNCDLENKYNEMNKKENHKILNIFNEKIKENKNRLNKNINNIISNLQFNKASDYKNNEVSYNLNSKSIPNSNKIFKKKEEIFSSSSLRGVMDCNFHLSNLVNETIFEGEAKLSEIPLNNFLKINEKSTNNKNKEIDKFNKNFTNSIDLIIDDYVICIDSDLFYSCISNKYIKKNNREQSISFLNKHNIDNNMSNSSKSITDVNSSTSFNNEMVKAINNNNKKKLDNDFLNINKQDLILKRKYNDKKFVNLFSKDLYSKGLFYFLNADLILNENKIKYITQCFYYNKEINIFKNNFKKNDFYFCDSLMFYFNLNHEKLKKKIKYSKESYEEFIVKEKHKYNKILKGNKTSCSNREKEKKMQIISI